MTDAPEPCCFDDWARSNANRARRTEIAAPITRHVVAALEAEGLQGRTVLDVGCGTGDLALACVARGATHATGIDLGAGAIEEARALARERGVEDRTTFLVGDGSMHDLPHADVVVLNRVVCCFPDARALLDTTLPVAGAVVALTAPRHRGAAGAFNRLSIAISNRWYAMRRRTYRGFRAFVHDLGPIEEQIRAAGFDRRLHDRSGFVWDVAIYARSSVTDDRATASR